MKAAVTVQKSAHRILLYGFGRAKEELPLLITDQRDFSPLLPLYLPTSAVWIQKQLSQKAQPEHLDWRQTSPGVIHLSPILFLVSCWPLSPSIIFQVSFLLSHHSHSFFLYFPFLLLADVSGRVPLAVTCVCWWEYLSWLSVTVWCLGTLTSSPGSSSPSGLWGERPGCEPSTLTSVFPSVVDTKDTHVHMHKNTFIMVFNLSYILLIIDNYLKDFSKPLSGYE